MATLMTPPDILLDEKVVKYKSLPARERLW